MAEKSIDFSTRHEEAHTEPAKRKPSNASYPLNCRLSWKRLGRINNTNDRALALVCASCEAACEGDVSQCADLKASSFFCQADCS